MQWTCIHMNVVSVCARCAYQTYINQDRISKVSHLREVHPILVACHGSTFATTEGTTHLVKVIIGGHKLPVSMPSSLNPATMLPSSTMIKEGRNFLLLPSFGEIDIQFYPIFKKR